MPKNKKIILIQAVLLCLSIQIFIGQSAALSEPNLGNAVFDEANFLFDHASDVQYEHNHVPATRQVQQENNQCTVHSDCSGFVSYVLKKVVPEQYTIVRNCEPQSPYPQAIAYAEFFSNLSADSPSNGWIKIASYHSLRRGDIIAWRKPRIPGKRGGNTGHIMIVADTPADPQELKLETGIVRFVDVPVIDSSTVQHFKPEELPPHANQAHRNGLGKGLIRLVLDSNGQAIGYWMGTYSGAEQKEIKAPTYSSLIEFARLVSNQL